MTAKDSTAESKPCTRCGAVKVFAEFGKCKHGRLGLKPTCRQCKRAESAEWRRANPDYRKSYYAKNKASEEKVLADRIAAGLPSSKTKEARRAYYLKNREHIRQSALLWARQNPAMATAKTRLRQCRMANATPSWADLDAIRNLYVCAQKLTAATGVVHHVDHIVPLAGPTVCGLHVEVNLQVLPYDANLSKGCTTWPQMP